MQSCTIAAQIAPKPEFGAGQPIWTAEMHVAFGCQTCGMAEPRIVITYCTQCRWLLRASWMAQELLTTFSKEISELTLRTGTGGVFTIEVGGELIWDRATNGGFPEIGELKRLVRDRIAPGRKLGHIDAVAPTDSG